MLTATVSNLDGIRPPAHAGDVGFDLIAASEPRFVGNPPSIQYVEYDTEVRIKPPKGHFSLIFPRSSISNYTLALANSVGVIDEGYRGNIIIRFRVVYQTGELKFYKKGDKIAQLVFMPSVIPTLVEGDVDETERGTGAFGSTGN